MNTKMLAAVVHDYQVRTARGDDPQEVLHDAINEHFAHYTDEEKADLFAHLCESWNGA